MWEGQLTVGDAIPGLVVVGAIRNEAEQVMGIKPVNSATPWPLYQLVPQVPALTFLRGGLLPGRVRRSKP